METQNQVREGSESLLLGGYTPFRCTTAEDLAVFNATKLPIGVDYEPVSVSTQVVAGTNFMFFCNAKVVRPGAKSYPVMVEIFRSLNAEETPVVMEIKKVNL